MVLQIKLANYQDITRYKIYLNEILYYVDNAASRNKPFGINTELSLLQSILQH